jgi:hypothetical protein
MKEDFLHYIWKHKLFSQNNLETTEGEKIDILNTGTHNTDAGPDFFNAKIKIGKTLWAGNVEIHLRSSDWQKHSHHVNKEYDNIILHVVLENDATLTGKTDLPIPTLALKEKINEKFISRYESLISSRHRIPCEEEISKVNSFTIDTWLERMMVERLERKSTDILERLKQNKNNWEETFYHLLAKNFGFKLNAQPFEELARSLSLAVLAKHKNNLLQTEAMLFGTAGLLGKKYSEAYPISLKKEFDFLKAKFKLTDGIHSPWKFLRLRPANFPTIRIAQFAELVHRSSHLFSKILECENIAQVMKLFDVSASEYWDTHYVFGKTSTAQKKNFGRSATENIIINTAAPVIFAYGMHRNEEKYKETALKFLENIPSENNSIIKKWESLQIKSENASRSQALLELMNRYCIEKKCLSCSIGNKLITS